MRARNGWFVVLVVAVAVTLFAQSLANFGVTDAELKSHTVSALVNGYVAVYPNRKAFNAASGTARAAFVKSAFTVVKAYTESAAFQSEYAKQRASAKPSAPAAKGSADDQYAKLLADQQKSLAEMKANVAKMSPDMQKQMAPVIKQMEDQMANSAKDPQMAAMMKQGLAGQAQGEQQQYKETLAKYEQRYPADPKVLIANRLHQFLDMTKDMPWNTKLVPAYGGKMKFADAQLESKSSEWKMCFRAGKDATDTARALATEGLKQLGK